MIAFDREARPGRFRRFDRARCGAPDAAFVSTSGAVDPTEGPARFLIVPASAARSDRDRG